MTIEDADDILNWIDANTDCEISHLNYPSMWCVYDGPKSEERTEVLGRGQTLREAVVAAAERPYQR